MLETIDETDWSSLTHAYGNAGDVPRLIRGLVAAERETRQHALYELYSNIWHQGTVYEATAHAVPFLVELLREPGLPDRHEIADLLTELATGNSYLAVHGGFDWYRDERNTAEFQENLEREHGYVRAAYEAVLAHLNNYIELARDEDDALRARLPRLMSILNGEHDRIADTLQELLRWDACEDVRASALYGLLQVRQQTSGIGRLAPLFRDFMDDGDEHPLVRLVAAQCWIESTEEADISDGLSIALQAMPAASAQYQELCWNRGDEPFAKLGRALGTRRETQLEWIREGLQSAELAEQALWVIGETAMESRSFAEQIAPALIEFLETASGQVKQECVWKLQALGEAAIGSLEELSSRADQKLRAEVEEMLKTIVERRAEYEGSRVSQFPKSWKPTTLLIAQIKLNQHEKRGDVIQATQTDVVNLGRRGPAAKAASKTLKRLLDHHDQWIRACAAWALCRIEQDPEEVMPTLLDELHCRPAGFIVLETLGDMGPLAVAARPALIECIERDRRMTQSATTDSWNHMDDMFREACRRTLARIQQQ